MVLGENQEVKERGGGAGGTNLSRSRSRSGTLERSYEAEIYAGNAGPRTGFGMVVEVKLSSYQGCQSSILRAIGKGERSVRKYWNLSAKNIIWRPISPT